MNKYKTFEELKEELGDKFEEYMYKANIELLNKLDKVKEYCMNDRNFVVPDEYTQNITDGIQDDILELLEEIE